MLSFTRPPEPLSFSMTVQNAKNAVQVAVTAGIVPSFPELWKSFKAPLSFAQYHKCGYCERDCISTTDGDVEHFAPKGELSQLDPLNIGSEADNLGSVTGRSTPILSDRAYWWKAYEWSNYLLACPNCNRKWKRGCFPVQQNPRQIPPSPEIVEDPLLLNPFDDVEVEYRFLYTEFGAIKPVGGNTRATVTISICGLDRPSLTFRRASFAADAFRNCRQLFWAVEKNPVGVKAAAENLLAMGDISREHAGMIRAIWKQQGLEWEALEQLATQAEMPVHESPLAQ